MVPGEGMMMCVATQCQQQSIVYTCRFIIRGTEPASGRRRV